MVWTNPQTIAFWTDAQQIGTSQRTLTKLQEEGYGAVDSLYELTDEKIMKQIIENCKYPPRIPNPAPGADPNDTVAASPFILSAKSLGRIRACAVAVWYHKLVGRDTSAQSMQWTRVESFMEEFNAMTTELESEDKLKMPIISKYLLVVPFLESFDIYLDSVVGVRKCPIKYLVREDALVPVVAPPLARGQLYGEEHGSLKAEMEARVSHTHPLSKLDNANLFKMLEKATRGTKYSATVAPFKKNQDGRGAYMALRAQHAGAAHWDATAKIDQDFLMSTTFTGGGQVSLEDYLSGMRQHYVSLELCSQNVTVALPTQHSLVGYMIENIQCNDPNVKAAIAAIKLDTGANGMRTDFERAAAFLLPTDPNKQKGGKRKRGIAQLSSTTAQDDQKNKGGGKRKRFKLKGGKSTWKKSSGKSGVELRYYQPQEYKQLSAEQKAELKVLRQKANPDDADKDGIRAAVSSVMQTMKEEEDAKDGKFEEIKSIVASLQSNSNSGAKVGSAAAKEGKKELSESECADVAATKLMALCLGSDDKKKSGRR